MGYEINLTDATVEELYILEHCLSVDEAANHDLLNAISLAIVARQALGETVSCYHEPTEHALHPEAA